jgi:type I restriction enzyme S subunit
VSAVRIKTFAAESSARSVDGSEELLTVSHITGVTPRSEKTVYMFEAESLDGYKLVEPGNLVVNTMWAWMGALGVARTRGIVSPSYAVYRIDTRLVEPRYIEAYLRQPHVVAEMEARSTGVWKSRLRLYPEDLLEMRIELPPRHVQTAIADFLETASNHMQSIVGRRRRQLELLASQRIEAARAPFRSAGGVQRLRWLPPIPSAWPIVHLHWLVSCLDGRRIPVNQQERAAIQGDIPYWGANGVVDYVNRGLLDEPLVLLGEDGAPFFDAQKDKAFYVDGPIWPNNHIHVLRANDVRPRFLAYYLNLVDYADFIEGSTRDKLTQGAMDSIPILLPPDIDQRRIESAISDAHVRIETRQRALARQVELLLERHQAVIAAAISGRLEIPKVAA